MPPSVLHESQAPDFHATQAREVGPSGAEPRASLIRWTHGLVNRAVKSADAIIILLAGGLFWSVTPGHHPPFNWLQILTLALVMMIAFVWVMTITRSYRVERYSRTWRPLADLIRAFVPAVLAATVLLLAFAPEFGEHHRWFLAWVCMIFGALVAGRLLDRWLLAVIADKNLLRRRVVVVGTGELSQQIVAAIRKSNHGKDFELIGVVSPWPDQDPVDVGTEGTKLKSIADLTEYAQNYAVDLVVIALPWTQSKEIFEMTRQLQWIAADVVVPFERTGFRPQFAPQIGFIDAPVLQMMHRPFKGSQGLVKQLEDYVIAAIALVLVSPLLVGAAIAIKLWGGEGPIVFRQARVGFNSKPFMMYKFRTMTVDAADDGSQGTKRGDQRITRVGAFLRRTSIDELPQLVNVLLGDMSIVGPRPHVAKMQVGEGVYSDVVRQYAARHRIKPGITGWAQINGMRGGIDSLSKATIGADLDLYYVANWSFNFDVKIMLRTLFRGLMGSNVF